jgi:hypothetical protein
MHYYMWYPKVQLQDGVTLAPSPFSNFTCFTDFSCILPMFHNFIQLFLSIPLFLNLQPASRTSSFILRSSTIKTHVHRQPKRENPPQTSEIVFRLCPTFISLSHLCVTSSNVTLLCTTLPYIAQYCPILPNVISSCIHLGILHIHHIPYISLHLIGC